MMTESLIRAVACIYGFMGLLTLPTVLFLAKYVQELNNIFPQDLLLNATFLLIPLINSVICFLISYLTWNFSHWGKRLALAYNGCWIASFTIGPIVGRLTESNFPEMTTGAAVFWLVVLSIYGGLTWFYFVPAVRARMRRK